MATKKPTLTERLNKVANEVEDYLKKKGKKHKTPAATSATDALERVEKAVDRL